MNETREFWPNRSISGASCKSVLKISFFSTVWETQSPGPTAPSASMRGSFCRNRLTLPICSRKCCMPLFPPNTYRMNLTAIGIDIRELEHKVKSHKSIVESPSSIPIIRRVSSILVGDTQTDHKNCKKNMSCSLI